jgi:hypothetical protein
MRFKPKRRRQEPACTTGTYRVQLEFCLDAQENGLKNMEAAEEHLRQTLPPTDSSSLTVALIDESPDRHNYVQFDIEPT